MKGTSALFGGAAAMALACLCGGLVAVVVTDVPANACAAGGAGVPVSIPTDGIGGLGQWDSRQMINAALVVAEGKATGVPPRGWVIAVATTMQESSMLVYANDSPDYPLVREHSLALPHQAVGHDHDSVGLFQQRPSPPEGAGSWGTVADLMTPATSASKFYGALQKVDGWQQMSLTDAAQRVQGSAFPGAYQKWEADAEQVVAAVAHVGSIGDLPGASLTNCTATGPIASSGWTQPVHAPIVSGFKTAERPDHYGVDLGAARGDAIHAASAGVVIVSECNASTGTCDTDGGLEVSGCGWHVEIRHAGDVVTHYCHMGRRPEVAVGAAVTAGQVLGFVGSSGNSSGPHLHYEVHHPVAEGHQGTNSDAISPVDWMNSVGAPLGQ